MKFTRKLIPALAMLVVSATMMSTASFAWFSMNRTVTATGMSATAVSPVNLLIKETGGTGEFSTEAKLTPPDPLTVLSPMSTVDPANKKTFYAINDGVYNNGAGGAVGVDTTEKAATFVEVTDAKAAGYYIDYKFDLKLSSDVENKTIYSYLSDLTITDATGVDIKGAVRVAVIVDGASKGIYGVDDADSVVTTDEKVGTAAKAIKDLNSDNKCSEVEEVATVSRSVNAEDPTDTYYAHASANAFKVTAKPVTVTVRVWIEGQDDDCINANAGVTFNVSLAFGVHEVANNA